MILIKIDIAVAVVFTIRKYGHSIRRDVSGRVWLDGSRVNAWWNW